MILSNPRGWVALFNDRDRFAEYASLKAKASSDGALATGLQGLADAKKATKVESGTLARIVAIYISTPAHDLLEPSLNVSIVEGPLLDHSGHVSEADAGRADQVTWADFTARQAKAAVDKKLEQRASKLMQLAESLEKAGKKQGALGMYRQIAKDFPGTPSAKSALERIKELESK